MFWLSRHTIFCSKNKKTHSILTTPITIILFIHSLLDVTLYNLSQKDHNSEMGGSHEYIELTRPHYCSLLAWCYLSCVSEAVNIRCSHHTGDCHSVSYHEIDTTQMWETLMSTYRNKCGASRLLQCRVEDCLVVTGLTEASSITHWLYVFCLI